MGAPTATPRTTSEDFTTLRERLRPDWTLTKLANASGVSRRSLVYYEQGNIDAPHSPTMQAIASALGNGATETMVSDAVAESYRKRRRRSVKRASRKSR